MTRLGISLTALLLLVTLSRPVQAGSPLGDDILAPSAPRPAPRSRPEHSPRNVVHTARSVTYAARSADGTLIATVEKGDAGDELWLHPAGAAQDIPRQLLESPVRLAAPSFSRDGRFLAYVDFRDDIKGDIWLFDIGRQGIEPRRLTGKEFGEDAPVFTPDGGGLLYHRQLSASGKRELMRFDLRTNREERLPIAIDAAFAAPNPDGSLLAFVSREDDSGGDLWLWEARSAAVRKITAGPETDLYPAWESGETILFSRIGNDTVSRDHERMVRQVFRLHLGRAGTEVFSAFPLTAGTLAAVAPIPAGDTFMFVAGQGSGGQVLSLPASGEIPDREDISAQWELARMLLERQPPDPGHARLACSRVMARETSPTREGALAGLALARLVEKGNDASAEALYGAAARRYAAFSTEAALAEIGRIRLQAARRCEEVVLEGRRRAVLDEAGRELAAVSSGKGADAVARALIDTGRLLTDYGSGASDQLSAIALYEKAVALPGVDRALLAEAAFRRAMLLARLEGGEGAQAALAAVAKEYGDQEEWAEAAIAAIVDQGAPEGGGDRPELAALAERYRSELPRLSMGAWNRIGDVAYRNNEWAKAKDAYRTVLEQFPVLSTPTAAARFALAEILYREERYAEATALYERQMHEQPEDAPLYQLARSAYVRRTVASGENLYRTGELSAARSLFLDLIRYEGRSLEAHRGYIKSVAAQGQAAELLLLYRKMLGVYPDDPVLLYAAGLCETYLPGKDTLEDADRLIARASERIPESEYPPQTRGYIAEVSETVHGKGGGLEKALDFYRRAWLLNRAREYPENRANLDLNIGNVAYLLGRNATAWKHYRLRLASAVPFDNPDTELLFHQRYAAAAFQMREKEAPVAGYTRALQLAQRRLDPVRPLDLFGRLSRRVFERIFGGTEKNPAVESALLEQQKISGELDRLGSTPPEAPPSPGWREFDRAMRALVERERTVISGATAWNREASRHTVELQGMLAAVERGLDEVPRLVETAAEIHDRLGLACLEAERFAEAREHFDAAFRLNKGLGHTGNLAATRRSGAVATYNEAQLVTGAERVTLLQKSRDLFQEVLSLLTLYPPAPKGASKRGDGFFTVGVAVALDKGAATKAAFGFSADQEKRLAETYLARISSELGDPGSAARLLHGHLAVYPSDPEKILLSDLYGVGLLSHRAAHVDYALGDRKKAADGFRRSTLISLKAGNPVSAMLNLVNWGDLAVSDGTADISEFMRLEAGISRLATDYRDTLPPLFHARYHNDTGVLLTRLAPMQPDDGTRQAIHYAALRHWDAALSSTSSRILGEVEQGRRHLRGRVLLNRGMVLSALGFAEAAEEAAEAALAEAREGRVVSLQWRALAAIGRYDEALAHLESLPPSAYDLARGELFARFAPLLEQLSTKDAEAGFALLERLSEQERIQVLGRPALGLTNGSTTSVLVAAAPHLAEVDRLNGELPKGPAPEREYLQLRIRQEESLLDALVGKKLEKLPAFYSLAGPGALRLAAASAKLFDAGVSRAYGKEGAEEEYSAAMHRFGAVRTSFAKDCRGGNSPVFCRVLVPEPVEAIDILERFPGRKLLRFAPLDRERWLLFTFGGKEEIKAEVVARKKLEEILGADPSVMAAFEAPETFRSIAVSNWGLSGTHLVRALEQRKPFRRKIVDPVAWWPAADPFQKLTAGTWKALLPEAHVIVLPGRGGLLPEAPSSAGTGVASVPLWEDERGTRHSLFELRNGENLALAVAPWAEPEQSYALGHLLTLQGIPSLIVGAGGKGTPALFTAAYGTKSVGEAGRNLPPGWLLLGDPGLDATQSALLGKRRFTEYGKKGVTAHNEGRYPQALAFFENAIGIAEENQDLKKHLTQLHRYARESAYAAGAADRTILHAQSLVKGISKEKPYSAEHADALMRLGLLQGSMEQFSQAAVSLKEGIGIFADLGLAGEQAAALADFGVVMENAVDYPAARSLFEESAGLRRTLKDELSLADQYRNLGRIHDLRLNQYAVADRHYAEAGGIYARTGKVELEAETLLERGRCQRLLGNFPAADLLYRNALAKLGAGSLRTRMRVILEQANNAWFQGRYQEAFDLREEVEKHAKKENWPLEQVMARNTGGLIWWTLGENKRALLELRGALERAEKLEVRRDEIGTTLNNIGLVQRESGDYKGALQTLEQALAIDRKLGSRWAIAYDLRNIGQTRLKMGDAATAMMLFSEAATLAGEIGDKVNLAKILLARGDAETRINNDAAAAASYGKALELADAMLLREVRWRALFGLARLQQRKGETGAAVESYRQAMETIEGLRAEIRLDQLKDGFLADKMDVYGGLVGLLVDLKREEEAFSVAERSRARNLIDILGRQRLSLAGTGDQELYDRQNRLKEQIMEQEALAAQASAAAELEMYGRALERLRADYKDILLDIERTRPDLMNLIRVSPLSLDDIRGLLEPGVVMLSYYQLPDRLLCWRVTRENSTLFKLPVSSGELSEKISSYRRMLQNLEPLERLSRELYETLLAGPLAGIAGARAIGIVPHASLHYLAFATLNDGRDYLVDRNSIFHLPAASVLRYTLGRRQSEKNLKVLAVGNPDLGNPSLDLPFAEREAGTLKWHYPSVTTLTRERATESWVREHIGEFGIIHLASHGEFDPVNPLFSAVRLARDVKADGRLQAEEIFGLDIKADLVVLSACQTGLGDISGGDDVVGMNRAFLFAGTHSLMSSLWRVSDVSTAILMKQFYRNYTKFDKGESLSRAMRHVKSRYPHPGYWGAFLLTGDYL